MDVRQLEAFARVYESGSLTQAAQEAYVSRQAMSKTIAQLEGELGPLFSRGARGVEPTDLAHQIYPHVRQILGEYELIGTISSRAASAAAGVMRVALEAGAAITLPAEMLRAFEGATPGTRVSSLVLPCDFVVDGLLSGRIDAAISTPHASDGVTFEPVYANAMTVVFGSCLLSEGEAAAASRTSGGAYEMGLAFLRGKTIFGVDPSNVTERQLGPYLRNLGLDTAISFERPDIALTRDAIATGLGGGVVENGSVRRSFDTPAYVQVPLAGKGAPVWQAGIMYATRGPSATRARALARFARNYMERSLAEAETTSVGADRDR